MYYGLVVQNANAGNEHRDFEHRKLQRLSERPGKHVLQSTIANYYNSSPGRPSSRDKNPAVMIMGLYRTAPMQTNFGIVLLPEGSKPSLVSSVVSLPRYKAVFSDSYIRRRETFAVQNIRWYAKNDTIFKHPFYNDTTSVYFNLP